MARFDVYSADDAGYLLDLQADFLAHLETRLVVPLLFVRNAPPPTTRLNPVFCIETVDVVMATTLMAAVHRRILRTRVANVSKHRDEIVAAIDFLIQGF